MYVNVNPAAMARSLQAFTRANGGDVSYSSALEFVARMCGFDAYRAQKAYGETVKRQQKDAVVFETVLHAWDMADGAEMGLTDAQTSRRTTPYRLTMEREGDQFRLCVLPDAVKDPMHSDGENVLDILLEINEGLPCVHLTNDPAGDMLLTAFGHAGGLLVREDEGALEALDDANPRLARHLAAEAWSPEKLSWNAKAFAINHDTKALWADGTTSTESLPDQLRAVAAISEVTSPSGAMQLSLTVRPGDAVPAQYRARDWSVALEFEWHSLFPATDASAFVEAMSRAFTVLVNRPGDNEVPAPNHLVRLCLEGGLKAAQRLVEVATANPEASYLELERLFRMTASVWAIRAKK